MMRGSGSSGLLAIVVRQERRFFHPKFEQFSDDAFGIVFFGSKARAVIEIFVEKTLRLLAILFDLRAERGQTFRIMAHIFERLNLRSSNSRCCRFDQVTHESI